MIITEVSTQLLTNTWITSLRKTRQMDHSQVCAWLLTKFQQ